MVVTSDTSQLRQLAKDLEYAGPAALAKVEPIVKKAAQNIKKAMQADANKSRHFKQMARTVTYDVDQVVSGGAAYVAEIGYDKSAGPAAALAGIAIFGTSKPGGATVRDPLEALNDEAPEFEDWLSRIGDELL